ncbi:Hypothetical protein PBC10988_33540 [Planctomycetales bacterium 10988]|nr:Hypothetical protein PBC10988_33540 [Planctomycetales bacterium 10988]
MLLFFRGALADYLRLLISREARQLLAAGFAGGMLLGLAPKDNLLALVLTFLIFSLRIDLTAVCGSAILFAWIGTVTDRWAHLVGKYLLTLPSLQPMWKEIDTWPLVPWTSFNNTVVMGQLVIGLVLLLPVYMATNLFLKAWMPTFRRMLVTQAWFRFLAKIKKKDLAKYLDAEPKASETNEIEEAETSSEEETSEKAEPAEEESLKEEVHAEEPGEQIEEAPEESTPVSEAEPRWKPEEPDPEEGPDPSILKPRSVGNFVWRTEKQQVTNAFRWHLYRHTRRKFQALPHAEWAEITVSKEVQSPTDSGAAS